ncbi:MAG: hypothetical protein LBV74_01205 [Tannerella sp.]|jgi:Ca2+/Na+ antiporter|nr:hypothetical protein [Tannerella sp.]
MKNNEVRIMLVLIFFIAVSFAMGWCSRTDVLLAIAIEILCAIFMLLSRIYNMLKMKDENKCCEKCMYYDIESCDN